MRVLIDLADRPGGTFLVVSAPGFEPAERQVRWTAGRRLLVAEADQIGDDEASDLANTIDRGGADAAKVERYGRLLFEAAFDTESWQALVSAAAGQPFLELAICGGANQEQGAASALQALRWEAIHDGTAHVAARGVMPAAQLAGGAAGSGQPGASRRPLPVGIVRLVTAAPDAVHQGHGGLSPVAHVPRVLFAIGTRLTDPRVRPGAEFMGIMRHLERNGGSIQPRLVESASMPSLGTELARFQPDILHVIGHGRWFPVDGCVKLQLRAESGSGDAWATADQLLGVFAEAAHVPRLLVLSACQTASAARDADRPVNALPFAARLVAGGVPVVVAMAGDISDTACRVFTRALTQAIGEGIALVDAVIRGRRAAFHDDPDLDSKDWMMPAIFLADHVPDDASLVDTAAIQRVRRRLNALELVHDPVFCGRREFIAAMDLLLDDGEPLNALVAYTPDAGNSYGGMRLLQELAARAVRAGHLPVLLGPYDQDQPTDHVRFAKNLSTRLAEIRGNLGLPDWQDTIVAEAVAYTDLADKPLRIVKAIRDAFSQLIADVAEDAPVQQGQRPKVVLLCHRVDKWGDAVRPLLAMLGPPGLSPGKDQVPVVLTGTDTGELAEMRVAKSGAAWVRFLPLGRFRSDDDDPEDILAYQWWLLNPSDRETPVYAPERGRDGWQDWMRACLDDRPLYAKKWLLKCAQIAVKQHDFTYDNDEVILDGYSRAML